MKLAKWAGWSLCLTLASSITLGCTSSKEQTGTDPHISPAKPQELHMMLSSEPDTLDSSKSAAAVSFDIMNATQEGLYRLDNSGKPQPAIAKEMPQISSDGLTYTILLKEDVQWADGTPVTAHDFAYAWKRTLNPETKSDYAFMVAWIKGGESYSQGKGGTEKDVAVEALDRKTLRFTLERPLAYMTSQLAFPVFFPQKREFVEQQQGKYGTDADKVLANGPFRVESWDHEQGLKLVRNEKYWDADSVKLEKVELQIVKDGNTAENLYQSGALDVVRINSAQADSWKDEPDYQSVEALWVWYLEMNEQRREFRNEKIRQAFALGIDRNAYVNTVFSNGTRSANGFVPYHTFDGNGGVFRSVSGDVLPAFDAAKAKNLLAEGLKELGLKEFPKMKLTGDDVDESKKGLEFLQGQLRQNLGIEVEIETLPPKLRYDRGQKKDYDLLMFGWGADYNDPMTFLDVHESKSPFNQSGFQSAEYDKLIAAARVEPDHAKRARLLVDAEKILAEQMPVVPIYYRTHSYLVKPNLKDVYLSKVGVNWEIKWASVK